MIIRFKVSVLKWMLRWALYRPLTLHWLSAKDRCVVYSITSFTAHITTQHKQTCRFKVNLLMWFAYIQTDIKRTEQNTQPNQCASNQFLSYESWVNIFFSSVIYIQIKPHTCWFCFFYWCPFFILQEIFVCDMNCVFDVFRVCLWIFRVIHYF